MTWKEIKNLCHKYWCYIAIVVCFIFFAFVFAKYESKIQQFSTVVQAFFAIILTIFTINYANSTKELVKNSGQQSEIMRQQSDIMNDQYEASKNPKIICYVQNHPENPHIIMMIIKNIGGGIAKDIKFCSEPDFYSISGPLNENVDIFKKEKGLSYMVPDHRIEFVLTNFQEEFDKKRETLFSIIVTYTNKDGISFKEEYPIQLYQFWGTQYFRKPPCPVEILSINKDCIDYIKRN